MLSSEPAKGAGAAGGEPAAPGRPPSPAGRGTGTPLDRLLADRPVARVRPGLERVRAILDRLGRPEESFGALHVGGTNGKGSVAATAAAVLGAAGARTGLYTSPHLVDVRERFRVDGAPLPEGLLQEAASRVRGPADDVGATYFEALTCVAFLAFANSGVRWAVVETGLGGRLDATNVLIPTACAITGVAVDHAGYLGASPRGIAAEKAGILKAGVPAAVGPLPPAAEAVVAERAAVVGAPLHRLRVEGVAFDGGGTTFTYRAPDRPFPLRLRTPLIGAHQARNAGLALLLLDLLPEPPSEAAVRVGLAEVTWRGRFQVIRHEGAVWVLDVAHNPQALTALGATLEGLSLPGPRAVLLSVLRDKPWRRMAALVASGLGVTATALVLAAAPSAPPERRWDAEEAAAYLRRLLAGRRRPPSVVAAPWPAALRTVGELGRGGTVVVTGSSYVVGDALVAFDGEAAHPRGR